MNRPQLRTLAWYVCVSGLAFGLGVWLGTWSERTRHKILDFSEAVGRSFLLNQHADVQYCEAEYDAAREAILAWLRHLEQLRPIAGGTEYRDPLMTPRGIAVDQALALGRLALLEERRGRTADAQELWRRAEAEARIANWKDASESRVRAALDRMDNCKSPTAKP